MNDQPKGAFGTERVTFGRGPTIATPHFSKHQRQEQARILRGALPPEILKRLAAQAKAEQEAIMRAAADAAIAQAEALAKAAEEYKKALPAKLKAEAKRRWLENAEKIA
jgi:hypothetical protein